MEKEKNGCRKSYFLFVLFIFLLIAGVNLGEVDAVWEKAVTICLSCMGID